MGICLHWLAFPVTNAIVIRDLVNQGRGHARIQFMAKREIVRSVGRRIAKNVAGALCAFFRS